MNFDTAWQGITDFIGWLGISPSEQDGIKALLLVAFTLIILVILGDIYRGEIQNTLHRVKLIGNPRRDEEYRTSIQLPKTMVGPTLDGVYSDALFYYRYRDHCGRLRTRRLVRYRARLKVRARFKAAAAATHELEHIYSEDERELIAKEKPDLDTEHESEIVAIARSRADFVKEQHEARLARAHDVYSKLARSRFRRFLSRVGESELKEPQFVGVLVKFHFPINPYFLLYKHPETNVRSTAWLTVMTSLFAIFMQLVYTQPLPRPDDSGARLARYETPASTVDHAKVVSVVPQ